MQIGKAMSFCYGQVAWLRGAGIENLLQRH